MLAKYEITYDKLTGDAALNPGGDGQPDQRWEESDVEAIDKPFAQLKPVNAAEAESKGLIGGPKSLAVFRTPSGGKPQKVKWAEGAKSQKIDDATFLKGVKDVTVNYEVGVGGSITGTVFRWEKTKQVLEPKPINWALKELGGIPYTVVVNEGSVLPSIKFAEFKLFSAIEFQQAGLDEAQGLVARGKIKPSLPFLKDLELDLVVEGENARVSKTFTKDDFKLPGPIQITEASLTLGVGTDGLSVAGDVLFKIERLGQGGVHGKVSTSGGFELSGDFNFDSKLFDPAKVTVGYKEGVWRGSGEIGIKEGKVKGVKSATITAGFEGEKITATGSVKPSIPGIEQGDMSMSYSPEEGLLITGTLTLKKDIPGIEGGSLKAQVAQPPGSDRYIVKATGEAVPKIPGVSAKLTVTYDDGAFDVTGTAGYEKGMLKGSVTIGATNRPVGDDGVPSGPPPEKGEKITLYGGGSVTLKIAPWLQATAAIKLKPNGEIEVTGKIGLPSVLEIFKEKKLEKNIFKIGIDIPIVGVAVAGQRIGIFANISGGLDLEAGIGPGQLQELSLEVTYNPAHEDQTKVAGDAKLHIPAHAGLRLFVRGSLGVGIPIVSASAGLEIGGTLGLEGALDASVHVEWTPAKGLDLKAEAGVYVEPKFTFDITGFVLVEADLFITTIELYSKKWKFASFEYGSGLRLGMKFPIHYEEGKPFDISLSDVQFEVPNVNASDILSGLIKRIA